MTTAPAPAAVAATGPARRRIRVHGVDRLALGAVAAFSPVVEYSPTTRAIGITAYLLVAGRLLWIHVDAVWVNRHGPPRTDPTGRAELWAAITAVVLVLLAAVLTTADAVRPVVSVLTGLVIAAQVLSLCPMLLLAGREALLRIAVGGFLIGQTGSAVAAVGQVVAPDTWPVGATLLSRAPGLSGHPNILGLLAAVAVLAAVGARRSAGLPAVVVVVGTNLAALYLSGSVTALVALGLGLVVGGVVAHTPLTTWLGALAAAAASALAATALSGPLGFVAPVSRVLAALGDTRAFGSAEVRWSSVEYARARLADTWFSGAGLDMTSGVTPSGVTHEVFVRAWFQGGLVLLAAFLIVTAVALVAVVRSARWRVAPAAAAVITVELAFALVNASWDQIYFWAPLTVSTAVAVVATGRARRAAVAPDDRTMV